MRRHERPFHFCFLILAFWMAAVMPGHAVNPDEVLEDPKLEQRARELSAEIRCMKCQNQSIDDSNADLAKDLRVLVRERLVAGDSNDEVLDYLVDRYGEFVLLKPRFTAGNLVLWLAPAILLIVGLFMAWSLVRRQVRETSPSVEGEPAGALSRSEHEKLTKILDEHE